MKYWFDLYHGDDEEQPDPNLMHISVGCFTANSKGDLSRYEFRVKGKDAKLDDFGEVLLGPVDDESGFDLCRSFAFLPRELSSEFKRDGVFHPDTYEAHLLARYSITEDEYYVICQALVRLLTRHSCGECA